MPCSIFYLGYEISLADLERAAVEAEQLDEAELEKVAAGDDEFCMVPSAYQRCDEGAVMMLFDW